MIGVIFGWILAYALHIAPDILSVGSGVVTLPHPFAWGMPTVNGSVIITCLIGQFVLFSNFAASINGMSDLLSEPISDRRLKRSTALFGATAVLCGLFPTTGFVPFASSPGTIKLTRVAARAPFILGAGLMVVLGFVAPVAFFFAAIPPAVGYAAMMVVFALMILQGIRELFKVEFTNREGMIVGISLMIGIGIMFLGAAAFVTLPQMLQYIASNGLIVGLIITILMEHVLLRKK